MNPPDGAAATLAGRLGLPAGDTRADTCIRVAVALLCPHVDELRTLQAPDLWAEAVVQLGIKVWDTGVRGNVGSFDPNGDLSLPQSATAGLVRGVWGLVAPLTGTGGMVAL